MQTWQIIVLVVLLVLIAILGVLYFVGKKLQKKQDAASVQMEANKQLMSMLVIDKKRMKLKEAGLPSIVLEQTPKYLRGAKVPIVKAKIGPKITNLVCDEKIFDLVPVRKEIKAVMNGIYIMEVKGLRSNTLENPQKLGFFAKLRRKIAGKVS